MSTSSDNVLNLRFLDGLTNEEFQIQVAVPITTNTVTVTNKNPSESKENESDIVSFSVVARELRRFKKLPFKASVGILEVVDND